jgi:hypothetical protein
MGKGRCDLYTVAASSEVLGHAGHVGRGTCCLWAIVGADDEESKRCALWDALLYP